MKRFIFSLTILLAATICFGQQKNIEIKYITLEKIDSAGGVDFSITWDYNDSLKIIKYIYFKIEKYN